MFISFEEKLALEKQEEVAEVPDKVEAQETGKVEEVVVEEGQSKEEKEQTEEKIETASEPPEKVEVQVILELRG